MEYDFKKNKFENEECWLIILDLNEEIFFLSWFGSVRLVDFFFMVDLVKCISFLEFNSRLFIKLWGRLLVWFIFFSCCILCNIFFFFDLIVVNFNLSNNDFVMILDYYVVNYKEKEIKNKWKFKIIYIKDSLFILFVEIF